MAAPPALDIAHPVATLTLRRPENANRLEPDDLTAIVAHVAAVNRDPGILVLQIRGEGKHLSHGYDITTFAAPAGKPIGFAAPPRCRRWSSLWRLARSGARLRLSHRPATRGDVGGIGAPRPGPLPWGCQ